MKICIDIQERDKVDQVEFIAQGEVIASYPQHFLTGDAAQRYAYDALMAAIRRKGGDHGNKN